MQKHSNPTVDETKKVAHFSLPMMTMLNQDMQKVLDNILLETMVAKFTSSGHMFDSLTNQTGSDLNTAALTLNMLAVERRRNLIAPIPVYPGSPTSEQKDEKRDRTESFSTAKDETSQKTPSNAQSPTKVVENYQTPEKPKLSKKKNKDKLKLIRMDLAFDNEGTGLATRCDVVYKTILRDFRRFFLDGYKAFSNSQNEKHGMEDTLLKYVITLFPDLSVNQCKTISLDLGCLLFPKEMAKDKHVMREMERRSHFDCPKDLIEDQILRIHGFLYKFSIDKIEECFKNSSLCQLFNLYVDTTGDERISSNVTMSKNASIYLKARNILVEKASKRLSLRSF